MEMNEVNVNELENAVGGRGGYRKPRNGSKVWKSTRSRRATI